MIVRDAHESGRFDAPDAQERKMLGNLARRAIVGVVTEAVGLKPLDGWLTYGKETKVLWEDATWELIDSGTESLPTPNWKRGTSKRTTVDITWAVLRHRKKGLTLLRLGGHLPAHLIKPSQKAANQAALDTLGPLVEQLIAEHAPDITTASFDLNRNLRRKSQRLIVREAFMGTGLRLVVPPKGTHRLAKIDGLFTTGDLPDPEMLPRVKRYDHRGVAMRSCACPTPTTATKAGKHKETR